MWMSSSDLESWNIPEICFTRVKRADMEMIVRKEEVYTQIPRNSRHGTPFRAVWGRTRVGQEAGGGGEIEAQSLYQSFPWKEWARRGTRSQLKSWTIWIILAGSGQLEWFYLSSTWPWGDLGQREYWPVVWEFDQDCLVYISKACLQGVLCSL